MEIIKFKDGEKVILKVDGELDMIQSKLLEDEINKLEDDVKELVFDLEKLDYTSSAGIRVFLLANKMMIGRNGMLKLINLNDNVYEIMNMGSLVDMFNVEKAK